MHLSNVSYASPWALTMSNLPHPSRFLGLPLAIRQRIYEHLIPHDEVQFPTKSLARPHYFKITKCDRNCRNLLLACRLVYNELAPIVYSTKHFIDQYRNSNLQRLQRLTPTAIQSLVKLTVFLNVSGCEPGWSCCKEQPTHSHPGCAQHDEPLTSMSLPQYQEAISEWYRTIDHLAPYIQPSRLHLYFICDVADTSAAVAAVTPLLNRDLPILAECNIRLGKGIDPSIQNLAHRAAEHSTGHSINVATEPHTPFPFLSLPTELRHQILQHTDLVTPYRQVDWNPRDGYYLHYGVRGCNWNCDPDDHHGCQFRQCWKNLDGHGCLCSRHHSAFSIHCRCWRPPIPLFLVSKALWEDAQEVFFMQNRFIIAPVDGYGEPARTVLERFEASIFWQDIIPAHFLPRLRFLEIVFPPLDEDYFSPRGPSLHDWDNTMNNIKNKLDLPNLKLHIYFADFYDASYASSFRKKLARKEGLTRVASAYMRIIHPLERLKANGLSQLFVHAAWPWSWTEEGRNTRIWKKHIVENDISVIERRLERRVMGEEYDSVRLGKNELEKSQWLKAHERSEEFASVTE